MNFLFYKFLKLTFLFLYHLLFLFYFHVSAVLSWRLGTPHLFHMCFLANFHMLSSPSYMMHPCTLSNNVSFRVSFFCLQLGSINFWYLIKVYDQNFVSIILVFYTHILKDLMPITFSSPRAQPEVDCFAVLNYLISTPKCSDDGAYGSTSVSFQPKP